MKASIVILSFLFNFSSCWDYYAGMFKKNDILVAQDTLYKERTPFRFTYAKYGRLFKCPITYFRVADRLGIGRGPKVQITRGGLLKKYLHLRIVSPYNQPISVNIYVGCENKIQFTTTPKTTTVVVNSIAGNEKSKDDKVGKSVAGGEKKTKDDQAPKNEDKPKREETSEGKQPQEIQKLKDADGTANNEVHPEEQPAEVEAAEELEPAPEE